MEQIELNKKNLFTETIKGALIGLIISLICILIFAFVIKLANVSTSLIKIINQFIKMFSILTATFITLRKNSEKAITKGLLLGFIYTLLAFLLFSGLNGKFEFNYTILIDILFGGVSGLIVGLFYKFMKQKNK